MVKQTKGGVECLEAKTQKGGGVLPAYLIGVWGADPTGFRYGGASRYYLTVKTLLNGLGRGKAGFLGLLPCKGCSPRPPCLLVTVGGGRGALLGICVHNTAKLPF